MQKTTCKNCKKNYDNTEVSRIYGMESMPYLLKYCSAKCYTQAVTSKKESEHPYDLAEKGRLYDALKQRNDELVEAIEYYQKGIRHFYDCIDFGKSFFDSKAITFMNESSMNFIKALKNNSKSFVHCEDCTLTCKCTERGMCLDMNNKAIKDV